MTNHTSLKASQCKTSIAPPNRHERSDHLSPEVRRHRSLKDNWKLLATAVSLPYLMDQEELAAYLGKSTAWCERARWAGEGPSFVKLGRHVRYRADDVMAWIDANLCPTTEAAE